MKSLLKKTLIFCGAVLLAGCSTFSSESNLMAPAPLVNFKPTTNVTQLWAIQATNGADKNYLRLDPAVAGNRIFVDDYDGNVAAYNTETGQKLWHVRLGVDWTSGITAYDNNIYLASDDGHVYALSQQDGSMVWESPVSTQVLATPTVVGGIVLVKSLDGALTALSAVTGQQMWRFTQSVPSLILHASSRPVVAGDYVVAGFANGNLAAVKKSSGRPLWARPIALAEGGTDIERMVDIDMSPVVVKGVVYVASYQGYIAALDLQSGRIIWRHKISSYTGLTADASRIYISDAQSYLWGFDQSSGAVTWRQTKLKGRDLTAPAVMRSYLVVGDGYGYVHWLSKATGNFAARESVGDKVIVSPLVKGNRAYIYTEDGQLFAFRQG